MPKPILAQVKVCKKCGTADRNKLGECRACKNAWRINNLEKSRAASNAWKSVNKSSIKQTDAVWRLNNPELRRAYEHKRRSQVRGSGGTLSVGIAKKLHSLQRGMCPCCLKELGSDYQIDHIVPLSLGGSNTDDNVQLLRKLCNLQKHAKDPVDFMQSRGFLL